MELGGSLGSRYKNKTRQTRTHSSKTYASCFTLIILSNFRQNLLSLEFMSSMNMNATRVQDGKHRNIHIIGEITKDERYLRSKVDL